MTPRRIQRQRTKGWRMPPNTVYVGRPTVWGNPFLPQCRVTTSYRRQVVERYRRAMCGGGPAIDHVILLDWVRDHGWQGGFDQTAPRSCLACKHQACWCKLCDRHRATGKPFNDPCDDCEPCHADILLQLANG